MINTSVQYGRLVSDPNFRITPNGVSVATFTLAVVRPGTYGDKKKTDFIDYVIWRKAAELFAEKTKKGTPVSIQGVLTTRTYKHAKGHTVKVSEVVVQHFVVMQQPSGNAGNQSIDFPSDNEVNSYAKHPEDDYYYISDDDVPF